MIRAALLALVLACGCAPSSDAGFVFGSESRAILSTPARVVVLSVDGRSPSGAAMSILGRRLAENGSGIGSVETVQAASGGRVSWNHASLAAIEHDNVRPTPGTIVLCYVPGVFGSYPVAIGETYGSHGLAIFSDTRAAKLLEPTALIHETGHVLGLVGDPSRVDRSHPSHDLDPSCVMFWQVGAHDDFCMACKRDLTAMRRP